MYSFYVIVFMPTNEVMNGNCSVGQLTTIGYSQHLSNGRSLNSAYVKTEFLSPSLNPNEVYIRSDGTKFIIKGFIGIFHRGGGVNIGQQCHLNCFCLLLKYIYFASYLYQ